MVAIGVRRTGGIKGSSNKKVFGFRLEGNGAKRGKS